MPHRGQTLNRDSNMRQRTLLAILALASSVLGTIALVPLAFSLPTMTTPLFPLASALWLVCCLGGPLLLLSSGLRLIIQGISRLVFWVVYAVFLVGVGFVLFLNLPRHGLLLNWVVMTMGVCAIGLTLRSVWLCAAVGGTWQGVILVVGCVVLIGEFFSPTPGEFPRAVLILFPGAVLAIGTTALAVAQRRRATPTC